MDLTTLSLTDAVGLVSLVRSGGWVGEERVGSLANSRRPWVPPDGVLQAALQRELVAAGWLEPVGPRRATEPPWDPYHAQWQLRLPAPRATIAALTVLLSEEAGLQRWWAEYPALAQRLAEAECLAFARFCLRERVLPVPPAECWSPLLSRLLARLSVAQCWRVLWASAGQTHDYVRRYALSGAASQQFMLWACERQLAALEDDPASVPPLARHSRLPRSQFSYVLEEVFWQGGAGEAIKA